MPTYVTLVRFTQQGIEGVKQGATRLEAVKQQVRGMGGEVKAFFLTMGQYDAVTIIEAPDDETVAKIALTIGSKGNVRSETLRAFTEEEYQKIVAGLP